MTGNNMQISPLKGSSPLGISLLHMFVVTFRSLLSTHSLSPPLLPRTISIFETIYALHDSFIAFIPH